MNNPSLYDLSQIFNVAIKVIAIFINVVIILPLQVREVYIVKYDRKYYASAVALLALNLTAIVLIFISMGLFYVRVHWALDPETYYSIANFVTAIYLVYSIGWLVLYKSYFKKTR